MQRSRQFERAKKKAGKPQGLSQQVTDLGATPVKLKLVYDDVAKTAHIEVRVGSRKKLNSWVGGNVSADQDLVVIRRDVERIANEACNYLGRVHGDSLNSSEIARTAKDCLEDIIQQALRTRRR